jgi:hypothetical protein
VFKIVYVPQSATLDSIEADSSRASFPSAGNLRLKSKLRTGLIVKGHWRPYEYGCRPSRKARRATL